MKKHLLIVSVICGLLLFQSCEKDETAPAKISSKEEMKQCKNCEGSWDIAKTP